jgi:3-oxoacyl-[acyl-carrier-protein] synthase III
MVRDQYSITDLSEERSSRTTTVIESLGVSLPPKAVTTREVLRGCHGLASLLPFEILTGIRSRRMAGEQEFSVDLAKHAVADCLARSQYDLNDIDLLLCANISRFDGPRLRFTIEPSTALRLKQHFGFRHALAFDISNACAGVFTALYIADALITQGVVERAMVVSGEYVTGLTLSAQTAIDGLRDRRLACLTLGDAGIALILERSARDGVGFHAIDLSTLGRYSSCCIGKATANGPMMYTDYREMVDASIMPTVFSLRRMLAAAGCPPDLTHVIPHQTTRSVLRDAARILHGALDGAARGVNMINNFAERGNTATTTHFLAVHDQARTRAIGSGDRVLFMMLAFGDNHRLLDRRRWRPPARRQRYATRSERPDCDNSDARGPESPVERGRVDALLLVIDRIQVVVRIDVVGRVVGLGRAPGVDLFADGELERRAPDPEDGFHHIELTPPARNVGDLEPDSVGEVVVVLAGVADQLDADPRIQLTRPFHMKDRFVAEVAVLGLGFLEVGEVLEENVAPNPDRCRTRGLGREPFAAARDKRCGRDRD